jgi:DNA-binding MarR family transcriptional regulator
MGEPGQLNVNDRVLLHISRFAADVPPEEHPPDITQAGIAAAVGISRTHVPRAVKGLIKDGLVEEVRGRVQGHERKMSVYVVTPEGLRVAEQAWKMLLSARFSVLSDGKSIALTGKDLEDLVGKKRAVAAVSQMRDGLVEIGGRPKTLVRDLTTAPSVEGFYGRDQELKAMGSFMDSEAKIMVVLGSRGNGTSTLARKFVDEQEDTDVLWVPLRPDIGVDELQEDLCSFATKVSPSAVGLFDALNLPNALVVFDDYHSFSEEVVEFFASVVESAGDTKMIITAREETAAYNWFYHKKHVDSGTVEVLRVRGLDEDSARKLLGDERIEEDTFRRIFMMTRGQPMALKMLRNGDYAGLKRDTVFTSEEIRYMLFLKDKVK